jgi:integrase
MPPASSAANHAVRTLEWIPSNPVLAVERPPAPQTDPDIRFLDKEELEALLRAVPDDYLGPTDGALCLTAAMTGLRQGELVALRWRDVDWTAGVIRVRKNYTRGAEGKPKSRRSSRAVPMVDRVGAALDQHFKRSAYTADDYLVFCHPQTGHYYDASKIRTRFQAALKSAQVRKLRFHDLRHTYGTRMAAAGAPLRSLQEWMGHAQYRPPKSTPTTPPTQHNAQLGQQAHSRRMKRFRRLMHSPRQRRQQAASSWSSISVSDRERTTTMSVCSSMIWSTSAIARCTLASVGAMTSNRRRIAKSRRFKEMVGPRAMSDP